MGEQLGFQMQADLDIIAKEGSCKRVLEFIVEAPRKVTQTKRPELNLALVIDRSGSMSGDKLNYAKQAALHILDLLQEQDWVTIVAFDDQVTTLVPSIQVTSHTRLEIKSRINSLEPGGSTNLGEGWLSGCQNLVNTMRENSLNRALLLSDGLANCGITDLEELGKHAKELRNRGISTSTFGIGMDFNEHLLEYMSSQGGGNFYYIEAPRMIPELFLKEFNELAAVTVRDVEIVLKLPAQVDVHVFGGWKHDVMNGELRILVGDMAANQKREMYVRLSFPQTNGHSELVLSGKVRGKGEEDQLFELYAEVKFKYVDKAVEQVAPRNFQLMERFSLVEIADAVTDALKLERLGEREKAGQLLSESLVLAAPYVAEENLARYQSLAQRAQTGFSEEERKTTHYQSYQQKKRR